MNFFVSDGNAKDTIRITNNMKFDYSDTKEPEDLEEFKTKLVEYTLRSSFFQKEPMIEINMLKLPIIMSPCLIAQQVNNDNQKKSLLDKAITFSEDTFQNFHRLIQNKELNILNINHMTLDELRGVMEKLKVTVGERNATLLRTELNDMAKLFTAGQVNLQLIYWLVIENKRKVNKIV